MSVAYTSKVSHSSCGNESNGRCYRLHKKIIPSKKIPTNTSAKTKTCSESAVSTKPCLKSKKTTQSDITMTEKSFPKSVCEKCGDITINRRNSNIDEINLNSVLNIRSNRKLPQVPKLAPVEQFYRNTNFQPSTTSIREERNYNKNYLTTITETPEFYITSNRDLVNSIIKIKSSDDKLFLDTDKPEVLEELKEFRNNNYFECHSSKSRIKNKESTTSLKQHECVYRFYLNERLYPVPLNTDHKNTIRCVQCHLPMDSRTNAREKINSTLQAKVDLGGDLNDVMLLLPASEPLIIKEKRNEVKKDKDEIYFGVIKLDFDCNARLKSSYEGNSLALKYEKGYREFNTSSDFKYKSIDNNDVLII